MTREEQIKSVEGIINHSRVYRYFYSDMILRCRPDTLKGATKTMVNILATAIVDAIGVDEKLI